MNYDKDIEKLYDHAKIANEEMSVIKNDIAWIKEGMKSMDVKVWGVLIGLLIALAKLFLS